jgi:CDP-4-dehydro-6-deoxyglucose reductase
VGDSVKVSKPLGKYNLPDIIQKDICLISTGTGIAPHKSFIDYIFNNKIPFKNLYLIQGTRKQEELLYRKELEELERKMPNFHYVKVLSRETKETWGGHIGYVHSIYKDIFKDKRPTRFFICGWRNMILEARDNLKEMGYDKSDIKFELYD